MQASKLSSLLPASAVSQCVSMAHYSKQPSVKKIQQKRAVVEERQREERRSTLLGPQRRYPFPGDVIHSSQFPRLLHSTEEPLVTHKAPSASKPSKSPSSLDVEKAISMLKARRHTFTIRQLMEELLQPVRRAENYSPPGYTDQSAEHCTRDVELRVMPCPKLLKLSMGKVFEGAELESKEMTLLNLTQKVEKVKMAKEDKTTVDPEHERLQLAYMFVDAARAICDTLHCLGHWADFIDPRSGKPYYTRLPGKLLESDSSYHQLGFSVERDAAGMCDVISSVVWSERHFVGTIFTDASMDCMLVKTIMRVVNREEKPGVVEKGLEAEASKPQEQEHQQLFERLQGE